MCESLRLTFTNSMLYNSEKSIDYNSLISLLRTLGLCSSDLDCHEKRTCREGKCEYPCRRGTCSQELDEKCVIENHKASCIGNIANIPGQMNG